MGAHMEDQEQLPAPAGNDERQGSPLRKPGFIAGVVIIAVALVALAVFLASDSTTTSSAPSQTPQAFMTKWFTAIKTGDGAFLYGSLNPKIISSYGSSACQTYALGFHQPTVVYKTISVGTATSTTFTGPNGSSFVVTNAVPVTISIGVPTTVNGHTVVVVHHQVVHIASSPNGTYTWFARCSSSGSTSPPASFTQLNGSYLGSWTNTTFGSSGSYAMTIHVAGTGAVGSAVTVQVALGGRVFGGNPPPASTFTGTVTSQGMTFSGNSSFFGQLTWRVTNQGVLTALGTNVPGGRVSSFSAVGTLTPAGMQLSYHVTLVGASAANGMMQATKVS